MEGFGFWLPVRGSEGIMGILGSNRNGRGEMVCVAELNCKR